MEIAKPDVKTKSGIMIVINNPIANLLPFNKTFQPTTNFYLYILNRVAKAKNLQ